MPSNAYLLFDSTRANSIVIDPCSKEQNDIIDYILSHGLKLDFIILTHEHFDHCWGVNSLLCIFPAKVVTTRLCEEWVTTPMNYFNKLYFNSDEMYSIPQVDIIAEDIDWKLDWNGIEVHLIRAKGHTNKSMCVNVGNMLFSGDTLIYNTRPFLKKKYGASKEDLQKTIERLYSTFDKNTIVFAGHGDSFELGDMKVFYEDYFGCNLTNKK